MADETRLCSQCGVRPVQFPIGGRFCMTCRKARRQFIESAKRAAAAASPVGEGRG